MINLFDITPNDFHAFVLDWFITGSRVICNPPPTDTDLDICALVNDSPLTASHYLLDFFSLTEPLLHTSWQYCGDAYPNSPFLSLKKDEYNLILMHNKKLFERWKLATEVCKQVNPCYKPYRVQIFESIVNPPKEMLEIENLLE
jgi:hypothetical protein